jgi:hypothetical protein
MLKLLAAISVFSLPAMAEVKSLANENNVIDGACFTRGNDNSISSIQLCALPLQDAEIEHKKYVIYTVYTKKFPRLSGERLVITNTSSEITTIDFEESRIEKISAELYKAIYVLEATPHLLKVIGSKNIKSLTFSSRQLDDTFKLSRDERLQAALISSY